MRYRVNLLLLVFIGISGCQQSDLQRYNALVKKEKESAKTVNDIFFGISFGMTSQQFYNHCWNMNKKELFEDGPGSMSVLYRLKNNELRYPAKLNFYPTFTKDKISSMWAKFEYSGWMPWNKQLSSDSLLPEVLKLYEKWYPDGNPFMKVESKTRGVAYVKVDGNRRILIRRYDDMDVKVDYTDIRIENIE